MDEEQIFKALADTHRRKLLDLLFEKDGQTLSDLEAHLPMTRFGAMKHLQVLEDAGLISTRKVGREKFHYLNPVPIQLIYERWVSKYAQPWTQALTYLKSTLEETHMSNKPAHIMHIFIRTSPEKLWDALTNGDMTQQYYFNSRIQSTWQNGAPYHYADAESGFVLIDGEVVESNPFKRLVTTFNAKWTPALASLPTSTVTWEIEERGDSCKLTIIHADMDFAEVAASSMIEGWAAITSGLKTLLETNSVLVIAEKVTAS